MMARIILTQSDNFSSFKGSILVGQFQRVDSRRHDSIRQEGLDSRVNLPTLGLRCPSREHVLDCYQIRVRQGSSDTVQDRSIDLNLDSNHAIQEILRKLPLDRNLPEPE